MKSVQFGQTTSKLAPNTDVGLNAIGKRGCKTLQDRVYFMCHIILRSTSPQSLPVWSSGQSSWLQIQRSGFDSRRYQIFWEVVGMERGTPVSTTEELLERESSGFGLEGREYGSGDPSR
jgi:hypothetical protein